MNHFEIDVQLETALPPGVERAAVVEQVRQAAAATLDEEGIVPPSGLAVLLTDEERIQTLNRQYRKIDRPTDVLSFPTDRSFPGEDAYLGDIAIAVPVAQQQAQAGGHRFLDELALLTVHGVLHLLGYDHLEPHEKSEMWTLQHQVLIGMGIDVQPPDEVEVDE
ncbi:MAG: rRNA maturation RNase YbeY [Candidatus Promineifilaceae bacterium]|nr:rRNA maturation RNase YbeY [Candidatus Promineifilaceae bacterium]